MRNTYMIDGEMYSAVNLKQAKMAAKAKAESKARAENKLENDAKLARTQFHAK